MHEFLLNEQYWGQSSKIFVAKPWRQARPPKPNPHRCSGRSERVLNKFVETNEIEFVFTAGPGVQATPFWTHPALEFESEALFPPGQRFVITGVVEGDDGMLLEATLLPNKTN